MQQGYIKLYRCILDKGWHNSPEHVAAWVYILMRGNYKPTEVMINGKIVKLQPGQFVTSRKQMSVMTGVQESKIERILSLFESEQQIEQQKTTKNRVISIVNWEKYQASEQQIEQQMNNKRTTNEQQMNTDNKRKKERSKKEESNNIRPQSVSESVWSDFMVLRLAKRAPITQTVIDGISREAVKASITLETALATCCERGWQSFKAEWYLRENIKAQNNITSTPKVLFVGGYPVK